MSGWGTGLAEAITALRTYLSEEDLKYTTVDSLLRNIEHEAGRAGITVPPGAPDVVVGMNWKNTETVRSEYVRDGMVFLTGDADASQANPRPDDDPAEDDEEPGE